MQQHTWTDLTQSPAAAVPVPHSFGPQFHPFGAQILNWSSAAQKLFSLHPSKCNHPMTGPRSTLFQRKNKLAGKGEVAAWEGWSWYASPNTSSPVAASCIIESCQSPGAHRINSPKHKLNSKSSEHSSDELFVAVFLTAAHQDAHLTFLPFVKLLRTKFQKRISSGNNVYYSLLS